jgi:hypothetical protein
MKPNPEDWWRLKEDLTIYSCKYSFKVTMNLAKSSAKSISRPDRISTARLTPVSYPACIIKDVMLQSPREQRTKILSVSKLFGAFFSTINEVATVRPSEIRVAELRSGAVRTLESRRV